MYKATGRRKYKAIGRTCVRELSALMRNGVIMAEAPALLLKANMISMSQSCSRADAEIAYQNAIVAARKTHQPLVEGDAYSKLIPIMLKYEDEDEALRYFQQATRVFEDTGQRSRVKYLIEKHVNIADNLTRLTFPSSALLLCDVDPSMSFHAATPEEDTITHSTNAPLAHHPISDQHQGGKISSVAMRKSHLSDEGSSMSSFMREMSSTNTV